MSIEISVDGVDATDAQLDALSDLVNNSADGLLQAVEATALPDVIEASQTVWGVETGEYSSSWQVEPTGSSSVSLFNDTEYAASLEYGWTLKNGTVISSPGVGIPTVDNDVDAIAQELESWIQSQLQ